MSFSSSSIPPSLEWPVRFCLTMTATTYVLSIITGNVSQVDRVWTFLPTIYTAYFALLPLWPSKPYLFSWPYTPDEVSPYMREEYSPRALMMLTLAVLWMCRLSYNTWRRGLFSLSDEDYRWAVLRQKVPIWFFQLTNITFIAFIQNVLLLLLGIPAHTASLQPHTPLATSDYTLFATGLIILVLEFTSDNQQFSFQMYKHGGLVHNPNEWIGARIKWTPEDAKRGFVTRGLWAWSRHPNFFCEQSFWIVMTAFPILAPSSLPKPPLPLTSVTPIYPLLPAICLCLLFFSSTLFTESITKSKYPEKYRMYQQRVAMFIPVLTPVWGVWTMVTGKKALLDEAIWGTGLKVRND